MNNTQRKYLLILSVALLLGIAYFVLNSYFSEWAYNLDKNKKNPYGTYLSYQLLKQRFQHAGFTEIGHNVRESLRKLDHGKHYNYLFINSTPYYDAATVDTLCRFAEAGNTVFISCESVYGDLRDSLLYAHYGLRVSTRFGSLFALAPDSLISPKLTSTFNFTQAPFADPKGYVYFMKYRRDTLPNFYLSFSRAENDSGQSQPFDSSAVHFICYEYTYDTACNLASLDYGKGKFIILLTAIPFTNYFMRTDRGLEYVEKVCSFLPDQPALWDAVSQNNTIREPGELHGGDSSLDDSPLYFILKNKALRSAWYLMLLGILIYAFFHARRRQQIIPLITPKANTSLQYVETIGQLYYHEEEHIEIAMEMRHQFLNYLRRKYNLRGQETDPAFEQQVAIRSGIGEERTAALFSMLKAVIGVESIDAKSLQELNEQLEYFYDHCK